MATINEDIKRQLEVKIPEIKESFLWVVKKQFDQITTKYKLGVPDGFRGISNDWTFARAWSTTVRPFMKREYEDASMLRIVYTGLDEKKLDAAADYYAQTVAIEWFNKINEKIGELTDANVVSNHGCSFTITGTRGGKSVIITQDMIVNVSSKGLMFNQFPARIRVDGKSHSAAAYKKLF